MRRPQPSGQAQQPHVGEAADVDVDDLPAEQRAIEAEGWQAEIRGTRWFLFGSASRQP